MKCVEHALERFDPKLSRVVLSKFEIDYALTKEDIARCPEFFSRTLQQIFRFGAMYVEREIVKELNKEFGFRDQKYGGFTKAVHDIRK